MSYVTLINLFLLVVPSALASRPRRLVLHDDDGVLLKLHDLETKLQQLNSTLTVLQNHQQAMEAELQTEMQAKCQTGREHFTRTDCATHHCHSDPKSISFNPPFSKPPVLSYGFVTLDVEHNQNNRISVTTSSITSNSAVMTLATWADSTIYASDVSWMACPRF